jgi:hypothetical protein
MDQKFKAFRDGILTVNTGIGIMLILIFRLIGIYIVRSNNQIIYNDTFLLAAVAALGLSINVGVIFWGYRKYRKNRLPFKKDRKTKLLTYTEIGSSLVCFSLLGAAIYSSISAYYGLNSMILMLVGLMAFVFMTVLYYDSLPEQVVDQASIESSGVAP